MRKNKFIVTLLSFCGFLTSFAGISTLPGAWKGPNDLMINLGTDGQNHLYVCYCGIFRTFGWVDFTTTLTSDSLIMISTDTGQPFEARFKIESDNRLVGMLKMGNPGDEWFFNGNTELVRQKPIMPDNLNQELEGVILPSDYGVLSRDKEIAWEVLSTLTSKSIGYGERNEVERLLTAKTYKISPDDMVGFRRVRSIQIDARDGIFSYPYFNCRFKRVDGKMFFEKTTGSQRKSGYVYQNTPESLVFLGGWSVNDDPQTSYGNDNSIAGTIYKISPRKAIMIFPKREDRVEIYELIK
ncbi:MAG: DUF4893 domain-containing protein [Muribaculaceae bacterium]|nr:DUF4893 domain-containing protein [Muribaculaceae bacterium]